MNMQVDKTKENFDDRIENKSQKSSQLNKYRAIIISVAFFIILDASVLIANFWLSFQIEKDATAVNISGRQRMLSQRISKAIYDIKLLQDAGETSEALNTRLNELRTSISLFDTTLNSFKSGGEVIGTDGKPAVVEAVVTSTTIANVDEGLKIWAPYKERLDIFLAEHDKGNSLFYDETLKEYSRNNNIKLLGVMNGLTTELAEIAQSKANLLRQIQVFGILLAFVNFLIVTFHFIRKLGESDKQIAAAQQETEQILETVDEGLFLVDKNLLIGDKHSSRLLDIFGKRSVKGKQLLQFLKDMISTKDQVTTQEYFDLLFDKSKRARLIGDLNPLKEVPVQVQESNSLATKNKFLKFAFKRVEEDGEIARILTTVSDITREIELREELKKAEKENDAQMDTLALVLNANPEVLNTFLKNCSNAYAVINNELKEDADSSTGFIEKSKRVLNLMHKLKGEANALSISVLADLAHKFESDAASLRDKNDIRGQDFVPLTVTLEKMMRYTENLKGLYERIYSGKTISTNKTDTPKQDIRSTWRHLYDLADTVANRQKKEIEFNASGLNDYQLSDEIKDYINTIGTQLIRNSIVHGIEAPTVRELSQKPITGQISLSLIKRKDGKFLLEFKDDGTGLDINEIAQKAIKAGIISETKAETMQPHQLINLLFHSGFSTADEADQDHGHGLGMSLVKQKTSEMNGKIRIQSKRGAGTTFVFTLPENT